MGLARATRDFGARMFYPYRRKEVKLGLLCTGITMDLSALSFHLDTFQSALRKDFIDFTIETCLVSSGSSCEFP